MEWFRITLTDDEQVVVNAERDGHPEAHLRRKMLVLWLLHCGLTRQKVVRVAIQDVLDRVPTTHAEKLASLITLNFQEFDNVSLFDV